MEPATCGEVETPGIAADFQHHRRKRGKPCCFLRHPQGIGELGHFAKEEALRSEAEQGLQTPGVGKAALLPGLRHADPQRWTGNRFAIDQPAYERQGKACEGTGIARFRGVDFGQCGFRKPAAQSVVKALYTSGKQGFASRRAAAPYKSLIGRIGCGARYTGRNIETFRQCSFNPRYLAAQGKNGFPRRDACRHDDRFPEQLFLLCSYGFQSLM